MKAENLALLELSKLIRLENEVCISGNKNRSFFTYIEVNKIISQQNYC